MRVIQRFLVAMLLCTAVASSSCGDVPSEDVVGKQESNFLIQNGQTKAFGGYTTTTPNNPYYPLYTSFNYGWTVIRTTSPTGEPVFAFSTSGSSPQIACYVRMEWRYGPIESDDA